MTETERIREKIKKLYQMNPEVHLNVNLKSPKLSLENSYAVITGVYKNIFQIEEYTSGQAKRHILQYADVLIKNIVILELEKGRE